MSDVAKPWLLGSSRSAIASVVRKLVKEGAIESALIQLIADGCASRFDHVAASLAGLCNVREEAIRMLFKDAVHDSFASSYIYGTTGLPKTYFPLLAAAIDVAREVAIVRGDNMGPKAQAFVLEKALASPAVQAAGVPPEFIERLRAHIGGDSAKGAEPAFPHTAAAAPEKR